jgi:cobalamin biosynthetic protein CobC
MARDHGGGLDAARARWGGARGDWLDLSTGINPEPFPLPPLPPDAWTALPDRDAQAALIDAARGFWDVPTGVDILAAPGLSAVIAALPRAVGQGATIDIPAPTYNEHAAAWMGHSASEIPDVRVLVHPNNPDGRVWTPDAFAPVTIVDESFCDVAPDLSFVPLMPRPGLVVLKSFGKFWGLAGLRLGFALGDPEIVARLREMLGPWPVSGPALAVGAAALSDRAWAVSARARLARDAARLDTLMEPHGRAIGGTDLFRLYAVADAEAFRDRLARHRILSRVFPYSRSWLRLGLPPAQGWDRLEQALA